MMRTPTITTTAITAVLGVVIAAAVGMPPVAAAAPHLHIPPTQAICPEDPSDPLVEPEALQSVDAYTTDGSAYAQQLSTGSGVAVAVLGDGIDPDNPDFIRPSDGHVITDYRDFTGDGPDSPSVGTVSFGAASAIAAQGIVTHDLSQFTNSNYPLPAGCNVRILGVAPGASIVALRVGERNAAEISSILQAINYAVTTAHVQVIDEPFAQSAFPDSSSRAAIEQANDRAVAAGVTVVEASGDAGPNSTIGSDAADPQVISAGASTDAQTDAQTGGGGARFFGNGHWAVDNVFDSSSGGVSQAGRTVDLLAPGGEDWAACEADPNFSGCTTYNGSKSDLQVFGGTAQASALTAGAAALVVSAYRSTHSGHTPTPAVVKQILTGTTSDLGVAPATQGSGLLNADAATAAALTWPGASGVPAGAPSNVVPSTDQLVLAGAPGATASGTVTLRNVGTKSLTVALGTRQLQTLDNTAQAVGFDATTLPTAPHPISGAPEAYKQLHFTVPAGAAELTAHMAWAGTGNASGSDAHMQVALFDPSSTFAGASHPEGGATSANSAEVAVGEPTAGTWTAVITSPAGTSGYSGVVGLQTTSTKAVPVGSITPTGFTLGAGKSRAVTVQRQLPNTSTGDQTFALTIGTSRGQQSAIGVIARPVLDPAHGHGGFTGTITGGDGKPGAPAQTATYPITVPSNASGLDASLTFIDADSATPLTPGEPVEAMLIDPHGNLADLVSNNTLNDPDTEVPGPQIQAFVGQPAPGRWLLVVAAANPVPGTEFEQDFAGQVRLRSLSVTPTGLPASAKTVFKPGSVHHITLQVTNNGLQPLLLGLDARSSTWATYQPVPATGGATVALPATASAEPTYSIPPDTRSFQVTASSSHHTQTEIHALGGGIDAAGDLSTAAKSALSSATATEPAAGSFLVRGLWGTSLHEIGPFTDAGAAAGQSTLTASLSTLAFDRTISSQVDNPYLDAMFGIDSVPPTFVVPGESTTLNATLTVHAHRGAHVAGVLNVVTVPGQPTGSSSSLPALTTGEVAAALPFQYTVTPLPRLAIGAPHSVHRGKKFVVTITHAGTAIRGATARFSGQAKRTDRHGRVTFRVASHARIGKAKISANRSGYTSAVTHVRVK